MNRYWFLVKLDGHINKVRDECLANISNFYLLTESREHRFWEHASVLACDFPPALDGSGIVKQIESCCFLGRKNGIEKDVPLKPVWV